MTTPFDHRVWSQPRWFHYSLAVVLAFLALYFRALLDPSLGSKAPFAVSILPVALAAYAGGFWPGMVASFIGLTGSAILFVEPQHSLLIANTPGQLLQLILAAAICIFFCIIAGRLRMSAMSTIRLANEIDTDRSQFKDVLESITDAFFAVNKDWNLVQANPAFERLVENGAGDVIGRNLWSVFPDRENTPFSQALHTAMTERKPQRIDSESDGKWYHFRAYPTALGVSVFIHDVTERKQFEQRRDRMLSDERVARSAAEEAGRMKEEFLATLSHELRTPMTSLLGWAEMLNRGKVSDERLAEGLTSIEQSARMQAKMVDELLDISRINAGKLKVESEYMTLSELAEEGVAIHRPAALAKAIQLTFEDSAPDAIVRGDSARLHQVFSNLISNAIKFSGRGGKVTVRVFAEGSSTCLSVEDKGEGMSPEFLPFVFDRFRQANSTSSRRYGGLGLGLAIAKQLIELQGGTIIAESPGLGEGSTFTVCLPTAALGDRAPHSTLNLTEPGTLEGVRILLVEDDDATRLLLTRVIEEHKGTVLPTPDAESALNSIVDFDPHVVLSDIGMPVIDGYAFMRLMRERTDRFRDVPSVALTAFARDSDRKAATDAGFTAFHTKPVNAPALIRTLVELAAK